MANPDLAQEVYQFLVDYMAEHEMAPSQREIAQGCFVSLPTVSRYLDILEVQGRIRRKPGVARSIHLTLTDSE